MTPLRRHTTNKERIMTLFDEHHALRASDVSVLLPEMPVSTICRNLEKSAQDGMLRRVVLGTRGVYYERATQAHDHFVCDGCETVRAIALQKQTLNTVLPRGAHAHKGSIVIYGHCGICARSCHQ